MNWTLKFGSLATLFLILRIGVKQLTTWLCQSTEHAEWTWDHDQTYSIAVLVQNVAFEEGVLRIASRQAFSFLAVVLVVVSLLLRVAKLLLVVL